MLGRPLKHYPRCSVPQVRRARSGRPHQRLDPRAPALLSACICNAVNWGAILEIAGAAFSRGRSCSSSSRRWASGSAGSRLSRATHPRTSRCATRSSMARLGRFSPSEKRQDPKRRTLSRVSTEPRPCEDPERLGLSCEYLVGPAVGHRASSLLEPTQRRGCSPLTRADSRPAAVPCSMSAEISSVAVPAAQSEPFSRTPGGMISSFPSASPSTRTRARSRSVGLISADCFPPQIGCSLG